VQSSSKYRRLEVRSSKRFHPQLQLLTHRQAKANTFHRYSPRLYRFASISLTSIEQLSYNGNVTGIGQRKWDRAIAQEWAIESLDEKTHVKKIGREFLNLLNSASTSIKPKT
jgi:hypothetical protein